MKSRKKIIAGASVLFFAVFILSIAFSCGNDPIVSKKDSIDSTLKWLNHHDSAQYVGKETCRKCHEGIYNTFLQTGMGKSIGAATKQRSSADFSHTVIYDKFSDYYYKAFWQNDTFRILEFRLKGKDTVHKRIERVDFIVGSGQHTNSHLQMVNGYINQAPMTYYTQRKKWDLPPGFENGHNSRFSRIIGLECMTCHNAFPKFVKGSENKYEEIPDGIDCERCHGPGSIHVSKKMSGEIIDTSKYIDYSIVNPAKLSVERQFDVCMRCHLQGNTVLAKGKSWYDFKPGMVLSDYMTVFLPRYKNADDEFIMASHADRLKQSECFIQTLQHAKGDENSLRPYKNALTCVTCHNPHVSVTQTSNDHFNASCNNCHTTTKKNWCTEKESVLKKNDFNCVSCHMPQTGSKDIPHVSIHDHYIRKPVSKKETDKIKVFIGLQAINIKTPDALTKARAYINQYEKFEWKRYYLDSAEMFLNKKELSSDAVFETKVQLYFIKNDFTSIRILVSQYGAEKLLSSRLTKKSYDNENAWSCYRIGEAFYDNSEYMTAEKFYGRANELAPYNIDFKIKYGAALMLNGKAGQARTIFNNAVIENPRNVSALTNLGYLDAAENKINDAERNYNIAYALDPDYGPLLVNFAGLKVLQNKISEAEELLFKAVERDQFNLRARKMLLDLSLHVFKNMKDKDAASRIIKKFLKLFPEDKDALYLKGEISKA